MHLPATLLVDLQYIYPSQFVPSFLSSFLEFYVGMSRDPLIGGLFGAFGDNAHLAWFKAFIYLEGCVLYLGRQSQRDTHILPVYSRSPSSFWGCWDFTAVCYGLPLNPFPIPYVPFARLSQDIPPACALWSFFRHHHSCMPHHGLANAHPPGITC